MNKTKLFYPLAIFLFALTAMFLPALASAAKPADLPEAPGTYAVPGNSKLKLRVFVYNAKNQGSSANPALALQCSLTDPGSTTVDGVTGWHLPTGTWTYRLNTGSAPSLIGGTNMAALTANSFNAWSTPDVASKVTFVKGANTSVNKAKYDGQNIISWGRTSGQALAVTYTWYYTNTGEVAQVDTIFNSRFAWAWANQAANPAGQTNCAYQNYYDAQNIMTHELGHWMGLNDSYTSSFTDNTMFGYGSPTEVKKNTLTAGDTSAVNTLY